MARTPKLGLGAACNALYPDGALRSQSTLDDGPRRSGAGRRRRDGHLGVLYLRQDVLHVQYACDRRIANGLACCGRRGCRGEEGVRGSGSGSGTRRCSDDTGHQRRRRGYSDNGRDASDWGRTTRQYSYSWGWTGDSPMVVVVLLLLRADGSTGHSNEVRTGVRG